MRTKTESRKNASGPVWTNSVRYIVPVGQMIFIGLITFSAYWLIAGFLKVVPNIGPILAVIPAFLSAVIFGPRWIPWSNFAVGVLAIVLAVAIQQTENIFLVPHIMGNALELHPVIIIIGILVLSSRIGVWGAILAAPIIALTKEILYFII